jgi:hypothetical protein
VYVSPPLQRVDENRTKNRKQASSKHSDSGLQMDGGGSITCLDGTAADMLARSGQIVRSGCTCSCMWSPSDARDGAALWSKGLTSRRQERCLPPRVPHEGGRHVRF